MSILTHKMKTARKDYLTLASRLFIPSSEGSGNSISDIIGNVVVTDDGTAEWTTAHAASVILTANSAVGGAFPVVEANQSFIFYVIQKVVTLSAFTGLTFGNSAGARLSVNAPGGSIADDNAASVNSGGTISVSGGQHFGAALFLNREEGLLLKYGSVENAGFAQVSSVDASAVNGKISPLSEATFSLSSAQDYYVIGLAVYNTPPSVAELLAALDETYSNVLQGHKYSVSPL